MPSRGTLALCSVEGTLALATVFAVRSPAMAQQRRLEKRFRPFGPGDLPAWLALVVSLVSVLIAVIFSAEQF